MNTTLPANPLTTLRRARHFLRMRCSTYSSTGPTRGMLTTGVMKRVLEECM
jgi:hypothetical protein